MGPTYYSLFFFFSPVSHSSSTTKLLHEQRPRSPAKVALPSRLPDATARAIVTLCRNRSRLPIVVFMPPSFAPLPPSLAARASLSRATAMDGFHLGKDLPRATIPCVADRMMRCHPTPQPHDAVWLICEETNPIGVTQPHGHPAPQRHDVVSMPTRRTHDRATECKWVCSVPSFWWSGLNPHLRKIFPSGFNPNPREPPTM